MKQLPLWLWENKECLFPGIGSSLVMLVIGEIIHHKSAILKSIKWNLKYFFRKRKTATSPKDDSKFISENPLDGITIPCGTMFEKTWKVQNVGTVVWKNRFLKCVEYAGASFYPENDMVKIPKTYPGETVELKVRYFAVVEGDYRSRWKMCDKNGNIFYPEKSIGVGVNIHVRKKANGSKALHDKHRS